MPFGLGKKSKEQGIDRSQFLSSYPVRNPVVVTRSTEEGTVELEVPLKKPSKWVSLLLNPPDKKVVKLDVLGTFVWQRCDGTHTVQNIIDDIASQFKLTKAEAAVSLSEFMKDLSKRGLIAFMITDIAQRAAEKPETGKPRSAEQGPAKVGEG
ncbi:PqqD family protein [Tardisphaera saccharovorans]